MCVFFFKQKTAYEMRISDWNSDVCSSDLNDAEESKSPHAPALAFIARHISHFLRNDVSRNLACRNIEMCHKQASCYSLNERVLMNILCSYEFIGIEEIEVKIASRHPSEKTRGGTPSRYGQIRPRHKSR